jgi:hypothetical protein
MIGNSGHHHHELFAIIDTAMILPPIHLCGVGRKVRAGNVVISAELCPTKPTEKALSLVGTAFAVAIDLGMVDPLR